MQSVAEVPIIIKLHSEKTSIKPENKNMLAKSTENKNINDTIIDGIFQRI